MEQDCLVKVDDCGFYIYWKSKIRVSKLLTTFFIITVLQQGIKKRHENLLKVKNEKASVFSILMKEYPLRIAGF